jgi:branched-chain amino acid transport system ATP-binding protein
LLTNPTLVVMDEPSEGLAPAVVEKLVATFRTLASEGVSILLVEQNLGVATAAADRILLMVTGELVHETSSAELLADEAMQRRYLGVERVTPA